MAWYGTYDVAFQPQNPSFSEKNCVDARSSSLIISISAFELCDEGLIPDRGRFLRAREESLAYLPSDWK